MATNCCFAMLLWALLLWPSLTVAGFQPVAQALLNFALESPLWKLVMVPAARSNIVKTAEANGVRWSDCLQWIQEQDGPWKAEAAAAAAKSGGDYPEYYRQPYHAYETGNLSWEAAWEQELAGRAVGARNFPQFGEAGEDKFRDSFDNALDEMGVSVPDGAIIVDLGCGTGTSTRRLAKKFPRAKKIIGMDLSPYFIAVGETLLKLAPKSVLEEGGKWITTIVPDERIELRVGDATSTGLDDNSVDLVCVGLVIHELPIEVSKDICREAFRILRPGGELHITEMDFESPAFKAQRSNPLLFSLIRSTEPYLDVYADGASQIRACAADLFKCVDLTAATGRHNALIARKGGDSSSSGAAVINDMRFDSDGSWIVADTHLKTWESKTRET